MNKICPEHYQNILQKRKKEIGEFIPRTNTPPVKLVNFTKKNIEDKAGADEEWAAGAIFIKNAK